MFREIVSATFSSVNENKKVLAKALAIPFFVSLLVDASALLDLLPPVALLLGLLSTCIYGLFAITTHRVILLGPDSVSSWGIRTWTNRETFFVLHLFAMGLIAIPFALSTYLLFQYTSFSTLLWAIPYAWLLGRLSLAFPGIAIDKGVTFSRSWQMTKDHQLLMTLVVGIIPLLLIPPLIIFLFLPFTFLLSNIYSTACIVFEVTALSMSYKLISGDFYGKAD